MAAEEIKMDGVAEPLRPAVEYYAALTQRLAGSNLAGLTLFGPVLTEEFDASRMTVSSVVVLGRMDLAFLRKLAKEAVGLGKRHVAAPLIMTPAYIAASLDSFPLELLEIHQKHETVLGEDHFAAIEPRPKHVRLQCERELKRILIRLRQGLLAAAGRDGPLAELLADVGPHVLRTLRGLLWLTGERQYHKGTEVLGGVERRTGKTFGGLRQVLRVGPLPEGDLFDRLYADVEELSGLANDFT